jgi:hypothetical protein
MIRAEQVEGKQFKSLSDSCPLNMEGKNQSSATNEKAQSLQHQRLSQVSQAEVILSVPIPVPSRTNIRTKPGGLFKACSHMLAPL